MKIKINKPIEESYNEIIIGGIASEIIGGQVENCYNKGRIEVDVNGVYTVKAGGIIGYSNYGTNTVKNAYNLNTISITGAEISKSGAIIAEKLRNSSLTASNNYYRDNLSLTDTIGNGVALTQERMKTETFVNILNKRKNYSNSIDWESEYIENSNNVWIMDENNINGGYPILLWQQ